MLLQAARTFFRFLEPVTEINFLAQTGLLDPKLLTERA